MAKIMSVQNTNQLSELNVEFFLNIEAGVTRSKQWALVF
jgi:hypothetical protein